MIPEPTPGRPLYIGVAAASDADEAVCGLAEQLGRELALAGALLVCGGASGGAMAAACVGARQAGGLTLGLLPGSVRGAAEARLSISLPTGLGQGRNLLLVRASDALVAIGGGYGTLSELALALRLGVPAVGLATWSLMLGGQPVRDYPVARDGAEAARLAIAAGAARRGTLQAGDS